MKTIGLLTLLSLLITSINAQTESNLEFKNWAMSPPMGWNSWDCFGPSVVEDEVKANADYMASNLKTYGWEYIVVDIRWYIDNQTSGTYNAFNNSTFVYDEYGRYMPSPTRFPSAANGAGFKPLADYVHGLGLKFGIHIMRGVPKVAVTEKLPIKGSNKTAADIYSTASQCTWLQDNYTIVADKEGAQAYYNSIFELYAEWGIDFVKIDDLSRPYHLEEIELIRHAIDNTGRPIVLSMSPGATPIDQEEHVRSHANMWRTVDDFWDNWSQLNYSFSVCAQWAPYIAPGTWPDADMLPLGHIAIRGERGEDRQSNFTQDEQYTLMTLWSIFKSPLMFGGHLPDNDNFTTSLITNQEVLEMHHSSVNNKQWYNQDDVIAWTANNPQKGDTYVALFNNGGDGFVQTRDLLYRSGTISRLTDGYGIDIDIEIPTDSKQLFMIVNDGGDGLSYDHADWIKPTIYLANGDSVLITDLTWEYASAGWGDVSLNKSISGGTLNIKGTTYANGIGTHSQSIISYKLPENTVRFKTFAGLDIGGSTQDGNPTVEFMISTTNPTPREVNTNKAIANTGRISRTLQRAGVNISADITGANKLYLVVTDAGDDFNYDHADWISPTIYKDNGDSLLLSSLDWLSATSGWSSVTKNKSIDGNNLIVNGVTYNNGFGCNSYSIITFDLPVGYTSFQSLCGFDDEVLNASEGVSIEFMIFTEDPANTSTIDVSIDLNTLGFTDSCSFHDMWTKKDLGIFSDNDFKAIINSHGAQLYRISPLNRSDEAEITLTTLTTEIIVEDTLSLSINIASKDSIAPTGWITLYGNDTIIATLKVDSMGYASFTSTSLKEGSYIFSATYGGDVHYATQESNTLIINVKKKEPAEIKEITPSQIKLVLIDGTHYLTGITLGDKIALYNIKGQIISKKKAQANTEIIEEEGLTLIEIQSGGKTVSLKTVLSQ